VAPEAGEGAVVSTPFLEVLRKRLAISKPPDDGPLYEESTPEYEDEEPFR